LRREFNGCNFACIFSGVFSFEQSYFPAIQLNGKPQKPVYFFRRYKNMPWEVLWGGIIMFLWCLSGVFVNGKVVQLKTRIEGFKMSF